jgi:hypothetical protein
MLIEDAGDSATHLHCFEKLGAGVVVAHRRITDRAGPDRSDE